jgi:hypothetical protein
MNYLRPDLGENTIAYKCRRYWIIELAPNGRIDWVSKSDFDYVLWDGDIGAVIAMLNNSDNGTFVGTILSHVDLGTHEYSSLREATKDLAKHSDAYSKAIG